MHYIYLFLVATLEFFSNHFPIVLLLLVFILPFFILLKILKSDKKKCELKRLEHEKEMDLKQAQIDYCNSYGKDA